MFLTRIGKLKRVSRSSLWTRMSASASYGIASSSRHAPNNDPKSRKYLEKNTVKILYDFFRVILSSTFSDFIYAFYLNLEGGNWLMLPGSHNLSFILILNMPEMDSFVVINWCYLYFYIYSFFQHWLKILTFTGVLQKHIEILKRSNITQFWLMFKFSCTLNIHHRCLLSEKYLQYVYNIIFIIKYKEF